MRLLVNDNIKKFHLSSYVAAEEASFSQAYHELGDEHVVEADEIDRLQQNLTQLKDLSRRMNFMMGELSSILKV